MTFRDRFMRGEASFDEIFDLTDEWNFSDTLMPLREYLGLTAEEEDVWVSESDEALEELMERERSRRILFADLDGTLLTDDKQITPKVHSTIHKALDEGHVVVLSSGRTLHSTLRMARKLDLVRPGCFLISFNGAQVYDIGADRLLSSNTIPVEIVRFCFDKANEYGIHIQAYHEQYVVAEHDRVEIAPYCAVQKLPFLIVERVEEIMPEGSPKMLVIENDPDKISEFRNVMSGPLEGKVDLFFSQTNYLEMVPVGVNKGTAVRFLCDHLGIPIEHSIAAGDMENDLTMIDAAGTGAVMCNGTAAVKEHADYITTKDNNHDGVAEIIENLMLSHSS